MDAKTLKDFLAGDHVAQKEYDDAMAKAKADGKEEGIKAFQELAARVVPVLASGYYPAPLKLLAVKAIKGETSPDAVESAVAGFDSTTEGVALKAAFDEQSKQKETKPGGQESQSTEDGSIDGEEAFQAEMARMDEMSGKKKEDK